MKRIEGLIGVFGMKNVVLTVAVYGPAAWSGPLQAGCSRQMRVFCLQLLVGLRTSWRFASSVDRRNHAFGWQQRTAMTS